LTQREPQAATPGTAEGQAVMMVIYKNTVSVYLILVKEDAWWFFFVGILIGVKTNCTVPTFNFTLIQVSSEY
jgi:hypothetical protein